MRDAEPQPPVRRARLADRDTGEQLFTLTLVVRIGPPAMIILGSVEYYFWNNLFVWFIIPDIAATALIIMLVSRLLGGMSHAAGGVLFPSARATPTLREYSEQESLVVRGQYVEAADSYRAIIDEEPTNIDARMRLGRLLETECGDPAAAEKLYRGIRTLRPTAQQDWVSSNALIDLYDRQGNRERLKAELLGLSRRFHKTLAGASARRRLKELTEEDAGDADGAS